MTHERICQLDGAIDDSDLSEETECKDNNGPHRIKSVTKDAVRFMLTNARSLKPKISSMIDAFTSLDLHFAAITETWFRSGASLRDSLEDIECSTGIKILHRSRDGRARRIGGGVAFAFNSRTCNFRQRTLRAGKGFEMLCAVGKTGKITRKFAVFTIYIPPSTKATELALIVAALEEEIASVKSSAGDPFIVVAGDFNHRSVESALEMGDDFQLIVTPPTRGPNCLDRMYTNFGASITESDVSVPLQADGGCFSDHICAYATAEFPQLKDFTWEVRWTRKKSATAGLNFNAELVAWDWETMKGMPDVNEKVKYLESVIRELTDKHFPLVRVRKRSNEDPWIHQGIRRLSKKKIRIYKKSSRSQAWWDTDSLLQREINDSKETYVEKMLSQGNSGKSFYAATKNLTGSGVGPKWNVADLFDDKAPEAVANKVLEYFGGIAGEKSSSGPQVPKMGGALPDLTPAEATKLLKRTKKTDSSVAGDPMPHLVREFPDAFGEPVADIFNAVSRESQWPENWKTEYLTIIPKNPNPASLAECRNISCTAAFSKLMENRLLIKLREELVPDPSQYGGMPKCGVEHLLIDLWEDILSAWRVVGRQQSYSASTMKKLSIEWITESV